MDKLQVVQSLKSRLSKTAQSHEDLVQVFEDYKATLTEILRSEDTYRTGLRRQGEELPDLQRLVDKKHDPILKGRLIDGLSAIKKKVEELEAPAAPEQQEETGAVSNGSTLLSVQEEGAPPPRRNMPTLGMD